MSNVEDIVKKVNDMTGYDAVTAALKLKVDEEHVPEAGSSRSTAETA